MYWAISSLTSNTVTKYDVAKIVKQSYGSGRTVGEMLRVFEKNAETPLQKTMILDHQYSKSFNMVKYHPLENRILEVRGRQTRNCIGLLHDSSDSQQGFFDTRS
jgi:hypothetical protein